MMMAGTTWPDTREASSVRACSGTDGKGRSGWATIGLTRENGKAALSMAARWRCGLGRPEAIDTTRVDFGGSYQDIVRGLVAC